MVGIGRADAGLGGFLDDVRARVAGASLTPVLVWCASSSLFLYAALIASIERPGPLAQPPVTS